MQPLRVSENIVPVSEFKAKAAEWLRRLGDSDEPLVITQNGKAAGVLISPEAFDRLIERERVVRAVEEGMADVKAGRVRSHEEVVAEMTELFGLDTEE